VRINGSDTVALTKLDVLDQSETVDSLLRGLGE
jgi:adenylosuccinate synthase